MTEQCVTERWIWHGVKLLWFKRKGKLVELVCNLGGVISVAKVVS
jgi:hypothetical protein